MIDKTNSDLLISIRFLTLANNKKLWKRFLIASLAAETCQTTPDLIVCCQSKYNQRILQKSILFELNQTLQPHQKSHLLIYNCRSQYQRFLAHYNYADSLAILFFRCSEDWCIAKGCQSNHRSRNETIACLPRPTAMYFASEHIVLQVLLEDKETARASF